MAKVKSATYLVLKLIHSTLQKTVAEGLKTNFDILFTKFIKELRIITKNAEKITTSDHLFGKLFSTAYSCIASQSEADMEMYKDLLERDLVKFYVLVLKTLEEKGTSQAAALEFESQLLSGNTFQIGKTQKNKKAEQKPVVAEKTKQVLQQKEQKPEKVTKSKEAPPKGNKSSHRNSSIENLTILITPLLGLKKTVFEQLQTHFNIEEQVKFDAANLSFSGNHKKNLLIVNSLQGLPKSGPKAEIKFFLFGLKENTKPDDIAKNVYLEDEYRVVSD